MGKKQWNNHHVYHERRTWESVPDGRIIRGIGSFIIPLAVNVHQTLHDDVMPVPLPSEDGGILFIERVLRDDFIKHGRGLDPVKASIQAWADLNEYETAAAINQQMPYLTTGYHRIK